MPTWSLYIIRCRDTSLYTGIAVDVCRRFREHGEQGKRCAKYLRGRAPLKLVFRQKIGTRGQALRMEYRVKRLPKRQKQRLADGKRDLPRA